MSQIFQSLFKIKAETYRVCHDTHLFSLFAYLNCQYIKYHEQTTEVEDAIPTRFYFRFYCTWFVTWFLIGLWKYAYTVTKLDYVTFVMQKSMSHSLWVI